MADLSVFHSRIAPIVLGCPTPTINQAIIDACIDFCTEGSALMAELDAVTTSAGNPDIELDLPSATRVARVVSLTIDGRKLAATTRHPASKDDASQPTSYSVSEDGTVRLYPTPDKAYTVESIVLLKPSRSATAVDDSLFERHAEAIASGALLRLLSMNGVSWANPAAAAMYAGSFRAGVARAEMEFRRQNATPELAVQFVRI